MTKLDDIFSLLRSGQVKEKYWTNPKHDLDKIRSEFERSEREFRDLMWITLKERASMEDKSIFGEKTPSNLHRIPTLFEWYSSAIFLHIIRDPRAVYASEFNRTPHRHYLLGRTNVITNFMIFAYILID